MLHARVIDACMIAITEFLLCMGHHALHYHYLLSAWASPWNVCGLFGILLNQTWYYYRFSGALCSDQYNPYSVVCMDVYIIYNEHYKLYSRTSIIQLASMEPRCPDNRDSTKYIYSPTIGIYLTFVGTKAIKCHAYTTIKVNAP